MTKPGVDYQDYRKRQISADPALELGIRLETAKLVMAEHLVEYREKRMLTQQQLADKLGVKQQVVARIENGSNITLETLIRFLNVLDIVLKIEVVQRKRKEQVLQFVA